MVKDKENPKVINLSHSAFNHPREWWDKILSSRNFEDVDQVELMKLLMYFPGAKTVTQYSMAEFAKETDCPLVASLP